ncbi:MAG: hypothetical protein QE271_12750 [Bacteriovoracaceae bacterium]|nr:hypothetical protein [Bacteriovoracaceae bacterium]
MYLDSKPQSPYSFSFFNRNTNFIATYFAEMLKPSSYQNFWPQTDALNNLFYSAKFFHKSREFGNAKLPNWVVKRLDEKNPSKTRSSSDIVHNDFYEGEYLPQNDGLLTNPPSKIKNHELPGNKSVPNFKILRNDLVPKPIDFIQLPQKNKLFPISKLQNFNFNNTKQTWTVALEIQGIHNNNGVIGIPFIPGHEPYLLEVEGKSNVDQMFLPFFNYTLMHEQENFALVLVSKGWDRPSWQNLWNSVNSTELPSLFNLKITYIPSNRFYDESFLNKSPFSNLDKNKKNELIKLFEENGFKKLANFLKNNDKTGIRELAIHLINSTYYSEVDLESAETSSDDNFLTKYRPFLFNERFALQCSGSSLLMLDILNFFNLEADYISGYVVKPGADSISYDSAHAKVALHNKEGMAAHLEVTAIEKDPRNEIRDLLKRYKIETNTDPEMVKKSHQEELIEKLDNLKQKFVIEIGANNIKFLKSQNEQIVTDPITQYLISLKIYEQYLAGEITWENLKIEWNKKLVSFTGFLDSYPQELIEGGFIAFWQKLNTLYSKETLESISNQRFVPPYANNPSIMLLWRSNMLTIIDVVRSYYLLKTDFNKILKVYKTNCPLDVLPLI